MTAVGIGRMLVASMHQAVAEHLPSRTDFYAPWLHSESLRTPRVSVAGIRAALSFLRREDSAYEGTVRRAGALAAEWTWQRISGVRRAWLGGLPRRLRARAACRLTRELAADAWRDTRVEVRWRKGEAVVSIYDSLFCGVRSRVPDALCGFYAAALERFLLELGVDAEVHIEQCAARGDAHCTLGVTLNGLTKSGHLSVAPSLLLVWLLGAGAAAGATSGGEPGADAVRPVVMPFEHASRDATIAWMGEGAAILITDALRSAGVAALTRDERMRALDRLEVPPLAVLSRATVLRIGTLVGASDVVVGAIESAGERLVLRARRIRLDRAMREPELRVSGTKAEFFDVCRRVAHGLFEGAGPAGPPPAAVVPSAFELYVKGLLAETMPAQVTLLQSALKAAPEYDAPRLALWQVFTANGDHAAAREALRAMGTGSPHVIESRFLTTVSLIHLGLYDEAVALLKELQAKEPAGEFLNNLGVLALRRSQPPPGEPRASEYFLRASARDPGDVDYRYNLGYAYWREGRPDDAIRALREAVRMDPADGGAHALVAQVLQASGQVSEAAREIELARRLSTDFDDIDLSAAEGTVVPRRMARLKTEYGVRREGSLDALLASAGQKDQQETARFYLDRGRRAYEDERDREAERDLERAIYLSPYAADAHLLLGRVYLRMGRIREAIDALKISSWCDDTADAQVALAEALLEARDEPSARAAIQRALALEPGHEGALRLQERISRGPGPAAL